MQSEDSSLTGIDEFRQDQIEIVECDWQVVAVVDEEAVRETRDRVHVLNEKDSHLSRGIFIAQLCPIKGKLLCIIDMTIFGNDKVRPKSPPPSPEGIPAP